MTVQHWTGELEIKAVDLGQRLISGYAAVAENLDKVRDIIDAKAFSRTLREKRPADVAVLIGHQMSTLPVGVPLKIVADAKGLYTETLIKPGPVGDDILETARFLLQHGQTLGMSIGYVARDYKMERAFDGRTARRLTDIDLIEYSFAASQTIANPDALVVGVKQEGGAMPYVVKKRGDKWCVLEKDTGKNRGCSDSEEMAQAHMRALYAHAGGKQKPMKYRIEARGDQFCVVEEDGETESCHPDRAAATARMNSLTGGGAAEDAEDVSGKTYWSPGYVRELPDSAFLFVEPGEADEEGRTIPGHKRHFAYKDELGVIDLDRVQSAIRALPNAKIAGLDDVEKKVLVGRLRRLVEQDRLGYDPDDASPEWKAGAPSMVRLVGYTLIDISDKIASEQKAMRMLGEDIKSGQRMRAEMRQKLKETLNSLQDIISWADMVDKGEDDAAKVARYSRELSLLDV